MGIVGVTEKVTLPNSLAQTQSTILFFGFEEHLEL